MPSDAAIRICFLAATVLLMEDVLNGCSIALSQTPNPTQPPFLDVRFLSGVVVFYIDDADTLD